MKLVRNFFTLVASESVNRCLGFVRASLMAAVFGVGKITDAFYTVAYVEFIFVRLAARGDGVIHNSFIPMFSQRREQNGSENAWRLSSEVFSVLLPILMVMIMVIELVLPLLVRYVMAPGFPYQSDEYFLTVQ